jgi:hypothetical protein
MTSSTKVQKTISKWGENCHFQQKYANIDASLTILLT